MTPRRADQRWRRRDRLCRSADFVRCYRRGRRRHAGLASLYIHGNDGPSFRLGATASRKVGNSVVRHRLKRWVREIMRRHPERGELPAVDIVVHFKPEAASADFAVLQAELYRQLERVLRGPG